MRLAKRVAFCVVLAAEAAAPPVTGAAAVPEVIGPVLLSYGQDSYHSRPAVAFDTHGVVHVVWCREPRTDREDLRNASLVHSRLERGHWTDPTPIAGTAGKEFRRIDSPRLVPSLDDSLYLAWASASGVWISRARASLAGREGAWTAPRRAVAVVEPRTLDLLRARDGSLHLVYSSWGANAGGDGSVGYTRSLDGGRTWSPGRLLAISDRQSSKVQADPQIVEDAAGRLHVAWYTSIAPTWTGERVFYARSEDRGLTWSEPLELAARETGDFRIGSPLLAAIGRDELHVIFVCGTPASRCGRSSSDGGASWKPRQRLFGDLQGKAGTEVLRVDEAGTLHLVSQLRYPKGLYYFRKPRGEAWQEPFLAVRQPGFEDAHFLAAALSPEGLHVAWERSAQSDTLDVTYARLEVAPAWTLPEPGVERRFLSAAFYGAAGLALVGLSVLVTRRGASQAPLRSSR